MATVDATTLTSVNDVLQGVGKAPVATTTATRDSTLALSVLQRENEVVQQEEWLWNHEFDVELVPVAGVITVPTDVLAITPRSNPVFTVKAGVLYNVETNTTNQWSTIRVDLKRFLDLDDLPPVARRYIVAKATRVYAERFLGNSELSNRLRADELDARAKLMNHDTRSGGLSALNSFGAYRVIIGRGQPLFAG